MLAIATLLALLQPIGDTVRIDVRAAFDRAVAESPRLAAASLRSQAAADRAAQSRALPNPALNFNAENLGRQETLTGLTAWEGTEGQAVISTSLPFGPERAGRTGAARAEAREFSADAERIRVQTSLDILANIGAVLRDQILFNSAREEEDALTRFAEVLALQAQEGRTSLGDAARAELSRGMASTHRARREAQLGASMAELARQLGHSPDTWITLDAPRCGEVASLPPQAAVPSSLAEIQVSSARLERAEAMVTLSHGLRMPDIVPQVGVRRAGGLHALYLGLSTTLPMFDRGSRGVSAARAEQQAATSELSAVQAAMDSRAVAASRSLAALEQAGQGFTATWFAALERAVTSVEAKYNLGEGTLLELLDGRRARLQANDDYAMWQSEWWQARAAVIRYDGGVVDASLLCINPFREGR